MRKRGTFKVVLGLYPPWWRAQYGAEVQAVSADLLAGGKSPWRVSLNLFSGAVRTRVSGANTPKEFAPWAGRTRASIVTTTIPLLVVLPFIFTVRQRFQMHFPVLRPNTMPLGPYGTNGAGRLAADALSLMAVTLVASIGTILLGYAELTRAVRAGSATDRPLRRVVRVPGLAAVLVVALWVGSLVVGPHRFLLHGGVSKPLDGHPALGHYLSVAAFAVLAVGWFVALVMSIMVAKRANFSLADLRTGKWIGITVSAFLWVIAAAAAISALALERQGAPLHPTFSVVSTSWGHWWILGALTLVLAATVSTAGAIATSRSWHVVSRLRP
jgi:hypothetical protein